jgi:ABC-type spermidine/putrescine transport system permease subunit II
VSGRGSNPADFLWLLLPLLVLAVSSGGAAPAGLAVGFTLLVVGPLLGGLIMLAKGRSVRAGLLVAALVPIFGHLVLLGLESRR